jgi:hypothetical protein
MSEFLFKNLSVRLSAAADDDAVEVCADSKSFVMCGELHTCGGDPPTQPPPDCGWCTTCTYQTCGDEFTHDVVLPASPETLLAEVRLHKQQLLRVIDHLDERERQIMSSRMPSTVEETDRVRAVIVDALEHLDEHRASLTEDK